MCIRSVSAWLACSWGEQNGHPSSELQIQIALDRARYTSHVRACLHNLSLASRALGTTGALAPALLAQQNDRVAELALVLERLANVKEFRTPQGIRSMSRLYVALIIPIFFGPYWGWIRKQINFGFAFFFSIVVR